MSAINGEYEVRIAGEEYILRYDWSALAEVEAKHGQDPNLFSPEVVASVAAFGLKKRHPEMTAEKIVQLSPPLVPFAASVQKALQWAYFGDKGMPEDGGKKKAGKGGFWRRIGSLFSKV